MIRRSVVLKLWLTIIGLVVIVLSILAVYLQQFFHSYVSEMQRIDLTNQAILVGEVLRKEPPQMIQNYVNRELSASHSHYYIIASRSKVGFSLNHFIKSLSADEVAQLSTSPPLIFSGVPSFLTKPDQQTIIYAINPIKNQSGKITAYLIITESSQFAGNPNYTIPALIVFAVILGTILTTGLAFVVSKNLSRPLVEMNQAAERLAKGQFDLRVRVVTQDEVGRLGKTFNHVAAELEQSMLALTQEKEQMAGILNAMMDIVIATDRTGVATLLNPSAEQWLRRARTLSMRDQESTPYGISDWPSELTTLQQSALNARKPIHAELQWLGRDLSVTMTPLYEPDHVTELRGTLAVMRDTTEEKRLDHLRKDFVANVSHELRTPLTLLQGYAEALMDNFGDDPLQQDELIHIIHDETLRMRRLVNELLDLAQLESGHFSMHMDNIDICAIVRRVAKKFHGAIQERGLQLHLDETTGSLNVMGDEDRLEQVLTNLVDNAFRHTKTGSITLRTEASDHQAVVRVTDTGEGISEKDLPFVFERFYKADKARIRTGASGGTGIGLAIVSSLIRAHHGEIGVQSALGIGTTFTIIIPLVNDGSVE